jgi:hypothetical protein
MQGPPGRGEGGGIKRINQTNLEYKNYTAKREGNNRGGEEMEMSSLNISTCMTHKKVGGKVQCQGNDWYEEPLS